MSFSIIFIILFIFSFGSFCVLFFLIPKIKHNKQQKINKKREEKLSINRKELENSIKQEIKGIDLKSFGFIDKHNVDIDYILDKFDCSTINDQQKEYVVNKYYEWKRIIERNAQYIINYFMAMVLFETDDTDNPFWEHYLREGSDMNNEMCLQRFRNAYTDKLKQELEQFF